MWNNDSIKHDAPHYRTILLRVEKIWLKLGRLYESSYHAAAQSAKPTAALRTHVLSIWLSCFSDHSKLITSAALFASTCCDFLNKRLPASHLAFREFISKNWSMEVDFIDFSSAALLTSTTAVVRILTKLHLRDFAKAGDSLHALTQAEDMELRRAHKTFFSLLSLGTNCYQKTLSLPRLASLAVRCAEIVAGVCTQLRCSSLVSRYLTGVRKYFVVALHNFTYFCCTRDDINFTDQYFVKKKRFSDSYDTKAFSINTLSIVPFEMLPQALSRRVLKLRSSTANTA